MKKPRLRSSSLLCIQPNKGLQAIAIDSFSTVASDNSSKVKLIRDNGSCQAMQHNDGSGLI
jgi:hypothetical protein